MEEQNKEEALSKKVGGYLKWRFKIAIIAIIIIAIYTIVYVFLAK